MSPTSDRTHYEVLGVSPDCSFEELRTAYRRMAREHHPDVADGGARRAGADGSMAAVNEAWRILSDTTLRRHYDVTVRRPIPIVLPAARPRAPGTRRQAWVAGVQAQMARLSRQAGRSATQTLLIRHPRRPRADYEAVVERLVGKLVVDAESRVRAARAAGAAPLDLGVAATLVGIRSVADGMRRQAPLGVDVETLMAAELLDRMWDVLAHELPSQLTASLGGNPHVAQAL
ncbi:MAG: J domain-containing protein, partial [Actinomycetota bacterium]